MGRVQPLPAEQRPELTRLGAGVRLADDFQLVLGREATAPCFRGHLHILQDGGLVGYGFHAPSSRALYSNFGSGDCLTQPGTEGALWLRRAKPASPYAAEPSKGSAPPALWLRRAKPASPY